MIEKVKLFYKANGHALQINLQHHFKEKKVIISRSSTCRAVKMANLSRKKLSCHVLGQQNDEKMVAFTAGATNRPGHFKSIWNNTKNKHQITQSVNTYIIPLSSSAVPSGKEVGPNIQ